MKDIHDLFENETGAAKFHDVVLEATNMVLSQEKLKKVFKALPNSMQNVAYTYGLDDSVFSDRAFAHIKEKGLDALIGK